MLSLQGTADLLAPRRAYVLATCKKVNSVRSEQPTNFFTAAGLDLPRQRIISNLPSKASATAGRSAGRQYRHHLALEAGRYREAIDNMVRRRPSLFHPRPNVDVHRPAQEPAPSSQREPHRRQICRIVHPFNTSTSTSTVAGTFGATFATVAGTATVSRSTSATASLARTHTQCLSLYDGRYVEVTRATKRDSQTITQAADRTYRRWRRYKGTTTATAGTVNAAVAMWCRRRPARRLVTSTTRSSRRFTTRRQDASFNGINL